MNYIDADFDKLLSADDAALDRLLDAIEAGETALSAPYDVPLPAGLGCWERWGPGCAWRRIRLASWIYFRLVRVEGQYFRRTRA